MDSQLRKINYIEQCIKFKGNSGIGSHRDVSKQFLNAVSMYVVAGTRDKLYIDRQVAVENAYRVARKIT